MKRNATAILRSVLFGGASLALGVLPANAVNPKVPVPLDGDVFLAFRASDPLAQGYGLSYLVKLGPDTRFANAPAGSSFDVANLGLSTVPGTIEGIGDDLSDQYGGDWYERADLHWSIFGTNSNGASAIIYGSRERNPVTILSTAWPTVTSPNRNSTATQINSVIQGIGGYRNRVSTNYSLVGTFQPDTALSTSYSAQVTQGATDFGSVSKWTDIEGGFGATETGTVLDLFSVGPDGSKAVGSFTIDSTGIVHFTNVLPPSLTTDSDGDGLTDLSEIVAGTDPHNASDYFRLDSVVNQSDGVHLSFHTVNTRTYTIEYSETLKRASWITIGTYVATSTGVHPFLDVDPVRRARAKGFYRINVTE